MVNEPAPSLTQATSLRSAQYISSVATAIYLYDILVTLDLEVEHIWSRFSLDLLTMLYFTTRYISLGFFLVNVWDLSGFHGNFSDEFCRIPFDLIGIGLGYVGWTGIMTLRVCALWRQRQMLVRLVWILWTCLIATLLVTLYLSYKEVGATMRYSSSARGCIPQSEPHMMGATPIAPAIYELFVTILLIIKVFDFGVYPSWSSAPALYRVIARDGLLYFMASVILTLINVITWYGSPGGHLYILLSLYWAVMSTSMARMVLNLRDARHPSMLGQSGTDGVSVGVGYPSRHQKRRTQLSKDDGFLELRKMQPVPYTGPQTT